MTDASVPKSCCVETPAELAAALASRLRGSSTLLQWLEPCSGSGAFLRALSTGGVRPERITAIDIDPHPQPDDSLARTLRGVDFLAWSAASAPHFDRIIANPPYVPLHVLPDDLQRSALTHAGAFGVAYDKRANYWLAFVIAAIERLSPEGCVGFVLPAAWDYADYARPLREQVGSLFASVEVYRSRQPLFATKREGSVVLVCEGFRQGRCVPTRHEHEDLPTLCRSLTAGHSKRSTPDTHKRYLPRARAVAAREVFTTRIGAVTGDNRHFLLTERQRLAASLPLDCFVPVVTRAHHILRPAISGRDWESLRAGDERVLLFRPSAGQIRKASVQAYMEGAASSLSRYKVTARPVWYETPLPEHPDGFVSGMSQYSPWLCLNRTVHLNATNTLYVVVFRKRLTLQERAGWCLSMLHPVARDAARAAMRVYGDGLRKLEPSDIASLPLVIPSTSPHALDAYREALQCLVAGNAEESERIALAYFGHRRA